ncbi:MAG TPA: winged helix-turn-helix domain-containing protein [Candidatus Bilamarchaeaceae archaeon]|nr:winged helix-turn-helix domain-containing protein [Candidatus Bilamarchaeaceae archaeon]
MPDEEIVINKDLLKAIGGETRIAILKALQERQKTQSELAQELKLSVPTVLEHLQQLEKAGLVQKHEEGRKWKYYRLTDKAGRLLGGRPLHVVVLLGIGLLIFLAVFFLMQPAETAEAPVLDHTMEVVTEMEVLEAEAPAIELNQTNATQNETPSLDNP